MSVNAESFHGLLRHKPTFICVYCIYHYALHFTYSNAHDILTRNWYQLLMTHLNVYRIYIYLFTCNNAHLNVYRTPLYG